MIKIIYAACLLLFSSAMFLFSKNKPVADCRQDVTGVVKELKGPEGLQLYVEGTDHKCYFPRIEKEGIFLASGTKVRICYEPVETYSAESLLVRINEVVFLP
jgi:hypothetical protein